MKQQTILRSNIHDRVIARTCDGLIGSEVVFIIKNTVR